MGAGRMRFCRGPSLMKHVSTKSLSTSRFSSFCVAFATADFTTFSISRVDFGLLVNFSVINASFTFLPRIKSTTRRAFCGDIRINRLVALLTIPFLNLPWARVRRRLQEHHRHPEHRRPTADPLDQRLCL